MLDAPLTANVALKEMEIFWFEPVQQELWSCYYENYAGWPYEFTATPVCLTKTTAPALPTDCTCGDVELLENRIVRVEQAGSVAPYALSTLVSECDGGGLPLGGSCGLEFSMAGSRLVTLASADFGPNGGWECHWNNPTDTTVIGVATAVCLQPLAPGSAPEPEPTAERVVHVERTVELPSSNLHLADVTCDAGDYLLWGSCALASPGDANEVTTFRSGFLDPAQNRPNTWQCGWNNPTDFTPTAKATAVCLKPSGE